MDASFIAQSCAGQEATANAVNDALLRQWRALAGTKTFDDDHGCRQRNSPPPPDQQLILATADLDN